MSLFPWASRSSGSIGVALLIVIAVTMPAGAQDVPLAVDPFADMTDLFRLTSPMTGSTGQTGSWDRSGGNGDAIFWYYLRAQPKRVVMADLAGPGCVSRIWVTAFDWNTARIEVFVDNPTTPVVSAYMRDFFGSGGFTPFVAPVSMPSTGAWVCNMPIPFQKSCRIEAIDARTDTNVIYYNISYRTYPPGTSVGEPFQMPLTASQQSRVSQFTTQWNNRGQDPKAALPGQQSVTGSPYIAPNGGSAVLANFSGAGVITGIRLAIQPHNWDNERWSRLRIRFDGSAEYAVDSPVGAFFGCGFPTANAEGLPLGTINGQMHCYLPMPYANGVVVELVNSSSTVISSASYTITYAPKSGSEIGRYRFHAQARSQTPTGGGQPSYRILQSTGKGHYIGCVLSIESLESGWGPLEGDELIYVNGESSPSIHGTGTEDYFNGGFYFSGGPVSWPFSGCSVISQSWPLNMSAYRLSIMDAVVFTNGIIVDIEHGGVNEATGNYWSTAFYYRDDAAGSPPSVPPNDPLPAAALVNGDFESGFGGYAGGEALDWMAYQGRAFYGLDLNTFFAASDQKYSGWASQKIFMRTPQVPNFPTGIAQQMQVSRGSAYEVTAHFRLNLGQGLSEGNGIARLGVSTSGTTYHEDPSILWTNAPTTPDVWHTVSTVVTAQMDFLAVFAEGVRPYNYPFGDVTLWIDGVTVQPTSGAPLPPSNLSAAPGNGEVTLNWNVSPGATGYNVKRATAGGGPYTTIASDISDTSHLDSGLSNGTTHYYVVTALNGSGESGPSNEVSATPSDGTVTETFQTMPSWLSFFDASWGNAAVWSIVAGGQSGNGLQISRTGQGSSAKVKVYTVNPNTSYAISVYAKCPAYGANSYWAECAYRLGSHTADDFDNNGGAWAFVQKFANEGVNGNGNTWQQYTQTFYSGTDSQISVGFKLGSYGGPGPTVLWDTLQITPQASTPGIALSTASLTASCAEGTNAAAQSFTVRNSGTGVLSYSISDTATWLGCSPAAGTSTGEPDTIDVTYSSAGLAVGTHGATITASDPNATNTPQTITVSLTVQASGFPGDIDEDGWVDVDDVALFIPCITGPNAGPPSPGCHRADIDSDSDVDLSDFGLLQRCMQPQGVLPDPNCVAE